MKQVFKYPLEAVTRVPEGKIVLISQQHESELPYVWVEHKSPGYTPPGKIPPVQQVTSLMTLQVPGTGNVIERGEHVGSCVCGNYVWHVYRVR